MDLQKARQDLWPAARKRAADEVMEKVKQQGELNAAAAISEQQAKDTDEALAKAAEVRPNQFNLVHSRSSCRHLLLVSHVCVSGRADGGTGCGACSRSRRSHGPGGMIAKAIRLR